MPASRFTIVVDGQEVEVEQGLSVAAALLNAGVWDFRSAVGGGPRGPLCAMGVCYECRVAINGESQQRACLMVCAPDMKVDTGG